MSVNGGNARFAVFLPVRNGGKYVGAAIASVLSQTHPDFELVILENKSSDDTSSVIREFVDPRIRIFSSTADLTIHENWHRVHALLLTGEVQAEFCTIIGHDDLLYPEFLARINGLINEHPSASLYQSHFDIIDQQGAVRRPCKPIPGRESHRDFFLARCWGFRDSFGTGYVFRSADYVRVGGIPDLPLLLWSDDLLFMRLMKIGFKAAAHETGCASRVHGQSASGGVSRASFAAAINAVSDFLHAIDTEFGDLLADPFGKTSADHFVWYQVQLLHVPLHQYIFDRDTSRRFSRLQARATESARAAGELSHVSFWLRLRRLRNRIYYFLKFSCFR